MNLFGTTLLQRFQNLPIEELRKMITLTPFENTVAGQQLIQIGQEIGIEKGELIGEILLIQRLLKRSVNSKEELLQKNIDELKEIVNKLSIELNI